MVAPGLRVLVAVSIAALASVGAAPAPAPAPAPDKRGPNIFDEQYRPRPPAQEQPARRPPPQRAPAPRQPSPAPVAPALPPRNIVFVLDSTASMADALPAARAELRELVSSLRRGQSFDVIQFQDRAAHAFSQGGMTDASPGAADRVAQWLEAGRAVGDGGPEAALEAAFALRPQVVYFISDGDFPDRTACERQLARLNRQGAVTVNVITPAVGGADDEDGPVACLTRMAQSAGGVIRFIDAAAAPPGGDAAAPLADPGRNARDLAPGPARAPAPRGQPVDDTAGRGLRGEYFEGHAFERRVMDRIDREIDFQWGNGTPAAVFKGDAFSVRWTGWIRAPRPGRYKFITFADHEARVWIDEAVVVDGGGTREGFADLTGKPQALRVEHAERGGWATMSMHWLPPGHRYHSIVPTDVLFHDFAAAARPRRMPGLPKGTGLKLSVFQGHKFERFLFSRTDDQIDSLWAQGLLDPRLPPDHLSLRWEAYLKAPRPGRYRLIVISDDGVRVYLDGKKVIERWDGGHQQGDAPVELTDKPHPLVVEYFEDITDAYVSLHWEQIDGFKDRIIPPEAFFTDKAMAERATPGAAEGDGD